LGSRRALDTAWPADNTQWPQPLSETPETKPEIDVASAKSVTQKLGLKSGASLYVHRGPPDLAKLLGVIPEGASVAQDATAPCSLILLFVRNSTELVRELPYCIASLEPSGALWVAYYKGSSGKKTDINRDIIREHAMTVGFETVAIISVNAEWSALRLKGI
jgi:Protein of unknown function (DUF3052)